MGPKKGETVKLKGLVAKPELNGCNGVVTKPYDSKRGRCRIRLDDGTIVNAKMSNIVILNDKSNDDKAKANSYEGRFKTEYVPNKSSKYITFFNNFGEPYNDSGPLICPMGREFQRVLIQEDCIQIFRDDLFCGKKGSFTTELPLTNESFIHIFEESVQVIIHDCMFARDSFIVVTDDFFGHGGMNALVNYFKNGGIVLVHCIEGIYRIGDILSEKFDCRWKMSTITSSEVVFTDRGQQLLGVENNSSSPMRLLGKVHFMCSPKEEALVVKKLYNKEEFKDAWDPDPDNEDAYSNYLKREEGQHTICIYEGLGSEGKLIWNGDRGQNQVLRKTFEKLLTL